MDTKPKIFNINNIGIKLNTSGEPIVLIGRWDKGRCFNTDKTNESIKYKPLNVIKD